jgi:hypothetical protein
MLHCDALLPLLQALTAAQDDTQPAAQSSFCLRGDKPVVFVEKDTALAVAKDGPCYAAVFELVDADFASEGAIGLVKDVLGCYFDALAEVFAGEEEVEGRWGDDDLYTSLVSVL